MVGRGAVEDDGSARRGRRLADHVKRLAQLLVDLVGLTCGVIAEDRLDERVGEEPPACAAEAWAAMPRVSAVTPVMKCLRILMPL